MSSQTPPISPTQETSDHVRWSASRLAPIVGLALSAGLFVAVLATGGQPVASAAMGSPAAVTVLGDSTNFLAQPGRVATTDTVRGTASTGITTPSTSKKSTTRVSSGYLSRQSILPAADKGLRTAAETPIVGAATSAVAPASLAFDPARSLQFPNWAGTGLGATTSMLVRLFGSQSVCQSLGTSECESKPAAARLLAHFDTQLENGRCEGMVVMAGLAFEAGRDLSGLSVADAEADIVYWSLSQVAPRIAARAEQTKAMAPSKIAAAVSSRIAAGRTLSLMMWGHDSAHTVLPVAVSAQGGTITMSVWDPNFPGELRAVTIDRETESWTYADAFDSRGNRAMLAQSGAGFLGFVENDLREGEHRARFAD